MNHEEKQRLLWVKLYEQSQDAGLTCRRYGISRPTLRKWRKRYQAHGKDGFQSPRPKYPGYSVSISPCARFSSFGLTRMRKPRGVPAQAAGRLPRRSKSASASTRRRTFLRRLTPTHPSRFLKAPAKGKISPCGKMSLFWKISLRKKSPPLDLKLIGLVQ